MRKRLLVIGLFVIAAAGGTWFVANAAADKVTICHKSPAPGQTLTVAQPAVAAHMAHGDTMGACTASGSK